MSEIFKFDPVLFSEEENNWLLDNVDKPLIVALRDSRPGVNPKQVRPLLERIAELEQLKVHENQSWIGFDAIRAAIRVFLREDAKWQADHQRNKRAPRFPSLYSYDSKGRARLGGPGSDAGQVRTYFNEKGNRVPFAIDLVPDYIPEWAPPGVTEVTEPDLNVNAELNRIECFCGHTEQFKPDSRASFNAARARMSKHLRKTSEEVERHRELYTNEFGG